MVNKKTYGFKGKYCTGCESVWEVTTTTGEAGKLVRYPDFPSYGLERQQCLSCKGTSPEKEPATLADKAASDHHNLFIKNVKKQSK